MIARTLSVLVVASFACTAAAQDAGAPETVLVGAAPCDGEPFDVGRLVEDIRVELTSDGIRDVRALPSALEDEPVGATIAVITIARVGCAEAAAVFVVRVDDQVTHKQVERTVDLGEITGAVRLRALALAAAELLRASWAELAIREPEPSAPPAVVAATLSRARARVVHDPRSLEARGGGASDPPPRPQRRTAAIMAAFLVRSLASTGVAPVGARAALDLRVLPELSVEVHAEAGLGSASHALGTIELGLAVAGVGLAYVAPIGEAELMIGARACVGAAWARGQPYEADVIAGSGAGPVVSVTAGLELDVPLHESVALRFGVDVGGLPLGFEARAGGVAIAGISGASIGAWAGLAVLP